MKYSRLLFLLLMLLAASSVAQEKYFFYVRFDPLEGNSSAIVEELEDVFRSQPEQFYVMLSQGARPLLADKNGWEEMRQSILAQQSSPSKYFEREEDTLNTLFVGYMNEQVHQVGTRMMLVGNDDVAWTVCFILSEQMYERKEDIEIMPWEFIKINQLVERGMTVRWYSYGNSDKLKECPAPQHPFYK